MTQVWRMLTVLIVVVGHSFVTCVPFCFVKILVRHMYDMYITCRAMSWLVARSCNVILSQVNEMVKHLHVNSMTHLGHTHAHV